MTRCASVTPHVDPPAARCELKDGHAGTHRVGLLVWNDPPLLLVGGVEPDLQRESDHWIDGNVYLSGDEPPL